MKSNYFTVDKEKIERRNAERDYTLSYHDLLDPDRKNERKNTCSSDKNTGNKNKTCSFNKRQHYNG